MFACGKFLMTKNSVCFFITVPGCGGNKLQARLNKADAPHFWCFKNVDYFDIWLNPFQFIPAEIDCWVKISFIISQLTIFKYIDDF